MRSRYARRCASWLERRATARPTPGPLAGIGSDPLQGFTGRFVRVVTDSDVGYALLPAQAHHGRASPFFLRGEGLGRFFVPFDRVDWGDAGDFGPVLRPGETARVTLRADRDHPLLQRPALVQLSVGFEGVLRRGPGDLTAEEGDWDDAPMALESVPFELHVAGRRTEELERALLGSDAGAREEAILELVARDDEATIPLLRRHAAERALRLAAVERLGSRRPGRQARLDIQ